MVLNMVQDFCGDLMIVVHTGQAPSDEEWTRYVAAVERMDPEKLRTIVFTDGGAPNLEQREAINRALGGKTSPGAVVSNSMLVRGAVTALSWFNPKIKAFSPSGTAAAFAYLGVPEVAVPDVWVMVKRLQHRLGAPRLQCIVSPAPISAAVRKLNGESPAPPR